jgi:hypothetical protein
MYVTITQIKKEVGKKDNKPYYVIYFNYCGENRFTYLNKISMTYWKNKGLKKLKVNMIINVFKISEKHFKIISFKDNI